MVPKPILTNPTISSYDLGLQIGKIKQACIKTVDSNQQNQ